MGYDELYYHRFIKGRSTVELEKLFPKEKQKIAEIALCSLSDETLEDLLDRKTLIRVRKIRKDGNNRWNTDVN